MQVWSAAKFQPRCQNPNKNFTMFYCCENKDVLICSLKHALLIRNFKCTNGLIKICFLNVKVELLGFWFLAIWLMKSTTFVYNTAFSVLYSENYIFSCFFIFIKISTFAVSCCNKCSLLLCQTHSTKRDLHS